MAEEKMGMPSPMGGLVRYFDEYKSKIQLKPAHVLLITILIAIALIGIHNLHPLTPA